MASHHGGNRSLPGAECRPPRASIRAAHRLPAGNRGRELVKPLISGQRYCKIDYDGPMAPQVPLGYNTYSVRAMRWNHLQLLEFAASLKLDARLSTGFRRPR
ncbi:MAG: hypothetical protein ACLQOO_29675 [Terriglobia bacterium]